jgi:hypothetical protein
MTEIQNPKQKTIALSPAHRAYGPEGTGVKFGIWSLRSLPAFGMVFGIWCLEFVIYL